MNDHKSSDIHRRISAARTILISICMALILCLAVPADTFALSARPGYIAHRGLSAKAPENTLAAFELAAQSGKFYGIEFDIWEASSEPDEPPLLLVMHNRKTGHMCGDNVDIRTITRDTLITSPSPMARGSVSIQARRSLQQSRPSILPTSIREARCRSWS